MIATLLRRLFALPEGTTPTLPIPDDVLAKLAAQPGARLVIKYEIVADGQSSDVVWWIDESTGRVEQ